MSSFYEPPPDKAKRRSSRTLDSSPAGRQSPPSLSQTTTPRNIFDDGGGESTWDRGGKKSDDFDSHEEVLNARIRAKAGSQHRLSGANLNVKRSSVGSSKFMLPAWQQDEMNERDQSPLHQGEYASPMEYGKDAASAADAYNVLPYQDSPVHTPTGETAHHARHTARMGTHASRKSLLDPSSFGFDPQNGDPRIIMAEKGGESGPAPVSNKPSARGRDDDAYIELITVPGLGAEYSAEEIKEMRSTNKRKRTAQRRRQNFKTWFQGDEKVCGCFTPKLFVVMAFVFLIGLAITLFFVIPRMPVFAVQTTVPLDAVPDGSRMVTHRSPTNFSMDMNVNLRADNTGGWVGVKASKMEMDVTDLLTLKKVGQGTLDGFTFPARKKTIFKFPVHFAYASLNVTGDQTYSHYINACGPKFDNTPRQALNLQFTIRMRIRGLLGEQGTSVQLSDLECPFTLQPDQT